MARIMFLSGLYPVPVSFASRLQQEKKHLRVPELLVVDHRMIDSIAARVLC